MKNATTVIFLNKVGQIMANTQTGTYPVVPASEGYGDAGVYWLDDEDYNDVVTAFWSGADAVYLSE